MAERSSDLSGFYKKSAEERRKTVLEFAGIEPGAEPAWLPPPGVDRGILERMIENVIGTFPLPLGIATNFRVNGKDYLVPMALEEPSVVAAASHAAKIARGKGGFHAATSRPVMIGQISLVDVPDPNAARLRILESQNELLSLANGKDPLLNKVGGGARDLEVRLVPTPRGTIVIVHLHVDVRDAMGANAVNTMAEALAPELARLSGGRRNLRIISNLAIHRVARAWAIFPREGLEGEGAKGPDVVEGVLDAWNFAAHDPFRCSTHNKGIMNGVSAVAIATGNDFRALEAGAHSYAAWKAKDGGVIAPLTTYEKNPDGDLVGTIEMPMAVGLVGGATAVHPTAKLNVRVLGVKTASELAEVMASVGLAQNFAALRALANEGIQKGHMALHARNVAVMVGAQGAEVDALAARLAAEHTGRQDRAKEILVEMRGKVATSGT
ncbi:MAG: hydroxymethylglutaryl-CoA reductase, degradative [Euryarchaeota archaeon]|nr:hydroxymethylglutaryl-CoA reductase, degradative [Euryarchaeota archaeon]MDE1837831.1 hydroxymethylglutaryl-CoA reductase, degradative [Euryarchaeota archaeon]MDE1880105.1 hydroxymethylglutaryl-CoA reductase, degradative [Euryarchaeota archaeon]MDE2045057.1 hydroxymethylglutaryl-CoA reductase, degradative [Thermoplasmata archaeon]